MSNASSNNAAHNTFDADEQRWSQWMVDAQNGDERAYQRLLVELNTAIIRYLRRRVGNQEFIEDCAQDILLAIHNARHTYQPKRLFRPWLFAIVRNRSIDYLRKIKTTQKLAEELEATTEESISLEESYTRTALQKQLMEQLPEASRAAIELTKIQGYSNIEAAQKLSISESAVKVRVHRGLNQLKQFVTAGFK
ncbi:RNA polymerase sigma factor [Halioxenophilus aromaticivorans]|uniref:Sigma-70 family RNA polymerase sigma factor n=1 Tax=Halioxenophilus aromaticivorans TaxID=1306992 RepID=A0AAV3U8Z1_9ALTE